MKNININVKKGQLVFIIGKIASGKSSLLSAIIGDLLPVSERLIKSYGGKDGLEKCLNDQEAGGLQTDIIDEQNRNNSKPSVTLCGSIAYTHQVPWI